MTRICFKFFEIIKSLLPFEILKVIKLILKMSLKLPNRI
jgi:hypothetical protein